MSNARVAPVEKRQCSIQLAYIARMEIAVHQTVFDTAGVKLRKSARQLIQEFLKTGAVSGIKLELRANKNIFNQIGQSLLSPIWKTERDELVDT